MACGVIAGHENNGALQSSPAEPAHAVIEQKLPDLLPPIFRCHRQMINPAAPAIVATKSGANDFAVGFRDAA